jgi:hypothetical protein
LGVRPIASQAKLRTFWRHAILETTLEFGLVGENTPPITRSQRYSRNHYDLPTGFPQWHELKDLKSLRLKSLTAGDALCQPYVVFLLPQSLLLKQAFATEPSFPSRGCGEEYGPKVPTQDHRFMGKDVGSSL